MADVHLPHHLSYSSISLWQRCPACWKVRYVDGDKGKGTGSSALFFGQAMSRALLELHRHGDYETEWARSWGAFDRSLVERGLGNLSPSFEHGLELIESYRDQGVLIGKPESEVLFTLPGVEIPILMYMDIETGTGIGEFKTSRQKWDQARVDTEIQGTLYWLGYKHARGHDPEHLTYVVMPTKGKPKANRFETTRGPDQVELVETVVRLVLEEMKRGEYPGLCQLHGTQVASGRNDPVLVLDDE